MELNKSLFIEKRNGKKHLDLNGEWLYCSSPDQIYSLQNLNFDSVAKLPLSVGWCLYESGKCGHPYVGLNSKEYEIIADRVWYFKKKKSASFNAVENIERSEDTGDGNDGSNQAV